MKTLVATRNPGKRREYADLLVDVDTGGEFLTSVTSDLDITEQAAIESLEVLDNLRFIKIQRTLGSGVPAMAKFALSSYGLENVWVFETLTGNQIVNLPEMPLHGLP